MTTKQVCIASKTNGERCRAFTVHSSDYCYMHDPERAQQATAARTAGGKARNKPVPAPPITLRTIADQLESIEQTIDRARAGDEPISLARLALYGVSLARPLVELGELESRIKALEEAAQHGK